MPWELSCSAASIACTSSRGEKPNSWVPNPVGACAFAAPAQKTAANTAKCILITHHPQPRVPCQAPVNPRFEHVVHALGRWLPVETRAGIEATDKANSLRKAPTH